MQESFSSQFELEGEGDVAGVADLVVFLGESVRSLFGDGIEFRGRCHLLLGSCIRGCLLCGGGG
jgi:hypothetical protein